MPAGAAPQVLPRSPHAKPNAICAALRVDPAGTRGFHLSFVQSYIHQPGSIGLQFALLLRLLPWELLELMRIHTVTLPPVRDKSE